MRGAIRRGVGKFVRFLGGTTDVAPSNPVSTAVTEITPCIPRPARDGGPRLNILLPSINAAHYFGGIHTAVVLYRSLCRHFPLSRIILVDAAPDVDALARFPDHALVRCTEDSASPRQIVPFSDRYNQTLPVSAGDAWLSTAWWTAYASQRMAEWQLGQYGQSGRVACLIQDFEPGFYPWSSRWALAFSTYRPAEDVAVFNTGFLAEYFLTQGLDYNEKLVFEPTLNDALRPAQIRASEQLHPRQKRIVIYGRPTTPRNAFELICESLRCWGWKDPRSSEWSVVAPGELAKDLDLGPVTVRALGKLDLDSYGELLATSAIGISLMISPHPSYPPLEMSAFGMSVLTNDFANKTVAGFSGNVRSIEEFSPESIAAALSRECGEWESRGMAATDVMDASHSFLQASSVHAMADRLAPIIARTDRSVAG